MRKVICTSFMLLAVTLAAGSGAPKADAAIEPLNCRYTCSCSGTPLRCCTNGGVESCKPTNVIACPQVYNC
jgi:hypothetical protein